MKQLSRLQSLIFLAGGLLMVVGAGLFVFSNKQLASWIFLVGAIAFVSMQMQQQYEGTNFVIRRLRRIMTLADVLFIVSGLLLLEQNFNFLMPLFQKYGMQGMVYYAQYVVHNNWVLVLFVAALLELYTMHRISNELAKEAKKL